MHRDSALPPLQTPRPPDRRRRRARLLFVLPLAFALSACSLFEAPKIVRGNRVSEDQLKQLVTGTTTKADATALLGSPTAVATFDPNTWIYIGGVTQQRVAQIQALRSQDVVALTFNDGGVLQKVEHLTLADSKPVNVVSRTTPSPGSEASFMQQLFGNIGRFNATGPTSNPGPGGNL